MTARLLGRMALVSMLVLPLAACSSTPTTKKISSKALCEGGGGTYSGKTCTPGTSKTAEQMCQAHGGVYILGEDHCYKPVP